MNLQKGLVGHWTMNDEDTSGNTLYDRSAYRNKVNLSSNNIDTGVEGSPIGEAFHFPSLPSSRSATVSYSNKSLLQPDQFTIHVVARNLGNDYTPIFMTGEPVNRDNSGYIVRINDGYIESIIITEAGKFRSRIDTDGTKWTVGTTTYDGSQLKTYISGTLKDTISIDSPMLYNTGRGTNIFSISSFSYADLSRESEVSDIRLYERSLSQEEISALYYMRSQKAYRI